MCSLDVIFSIDIFLLIEEGLGIVDIINKKGYFDIYNLINKIYRSIF